jgi:hypothetical protein
MESGHRWLIPIGAAIIAVALFIAGLVAWRMMSAPHVCSPDVICGVYDPSERHQIHPLRAEGLWALSALFAIIALVSAVRPLTGAGRSAAPSAT